jgi:hypothetical protein
MVLKLVCEETYSYVHGIHPKPQNDTAITPASKEEEKSDGPDVSKNGRQEMWHQV